MQLNFAMLMPIDVVLACNRKALIIGDYSTVSKSFKKSANGTQQCEPIHSYLHITLKYLHKDTMHIIIGYARYYVQQQQADLSDACRGETGFVQI